MSISIIISTAYQDPIREKNIKELIGDIRNQSVKVNEVILVRSVRPRTRAHNLGVKNAHGDIIIFFDDDVRLSHDQVIEKMITSLLNDKSIGVLGGKIAISPHSTIFQKKCDKELLRAQSGLVSHAALVIRKEHYLSIGMEDESLRLNDDLWLNYKMRQAGYQTKVIEEAIIFHPQISNYQELLKKFFSQGVDQACDYKINPSAILNSPIVQSKPIKKSSPIQQIFRNVKILFFAVFSGRYLLLSARLATGVGFFWGNITYAKQGLVCGNEKIEIIPFSSL